MDSKNGLNDSLVASIYRADDVHDELYWARRKRTRNYVICFIFYFCFGITMYTSVVENWSFTDAVCFITITFTTVGFGIVAPTTSLSRAFTGFFIISGLVLLVAVIKDAARTLANEKVRLAKRLKDRALRGHYHAAQDSLSSHGNESYFPRHLPDWVPPLPPVVEKMLVCLRAAYSKYPGTMRLSLLCIFIMIFAALFCQLENGRYTYLDSLYFAVVAATTVGYGDLHPTNDSSKWLIVLLLPPAIFLISSWLNYVAAMIVGEEPRASAAPLARFDYANDLNLDELLDECRHHGTGILHGGGTVDSSTTILTSGTSASTKSIASERQSWHSGAHLLAFEDARVAGRGVVGEADYLSYALVKAGIVDADFVQRLRADFKALDVTDQGVLSEKDLREGLNQLRDDFTLAATVAADNVERRSSDGSLSSGFSEALEANAGESMRLPVLNKPQQGEENHV